MTILVLLIGVVIAITIVAGAIRVPSTALRAGAAVVAVIVLFLSVLVGSIRYVGEDEVGVVIKKVGFSNLPEGDIIAVASEKGPQAQVLPPGWHPWYWPVIFDIENSRIQQIPEGQVGLITTTDGQPLPSGEIYAPEWGEAEFQRMLDASYFLTEGGGYKGPQASVLPPGSYRLNPRLFNVEMVPVTNVEKATVGVVKSNVGRLPDEAGTAVGEGQLVERGQRGIWREPFTPQKLYLHTRAYEVTTISTKERIVRYTQLNASGAEEREIRVRTSDGFTFPVDVRVQYTIKPEDAPLVVAKVGDDQKGLQDVMNSAVRAIFRNNAESVKALDYVNQRSQQESQSLQMLVQEMRKVGVTVTAVNIGDVGDEESLGSLLKTQTDREIALQEQLTFEEQQRAAEKKKELTRTEQEAEEEKRLATAKYEVSIAEQDKEKQIIGANAEAEAIRIKAEAQAEAYRVIAEQIGQGNAALVELLKIVGERDINITPRVMVVGGENGSKATDAETTALIGTMLDSMLSKEEEK
ncbi:MAG: SPFH domain-containing protein [Planctomycetota bacterium]